MESHAPDKWQELTRRAFVFSAFTALAYVDIKGLHPRHIGKTTDGRRYIKINRKKTNVEAFILLHPVAEQILSLYNTTDDGKPVFPLPNRGQLWYCINEIGFLAGVKGNLSYHQSRHASAFGGYSYREYQQDDGAYQHLNDPNLCQSNR